MARRIVVILAVLAVSIDAGISSQTAECLLKAEDLLKSTSSLSLYRSRYTAFYDRSNSEREDLYLIEEEHLSLSVKRMYHIVIIVQLL
jgi:hypothetical protein